MKRRIQFALLIVAGVVMLLSSGARNARLIDARRTHGLNAAEPLENAPPFLAFATVALGGFRGIVADILWLRVSHLQERDAFAEIVQLSSLITRLQPRFADVWAYHAWNMAYNVSFAYPRAEDRWRWVQHGIELLRDDGIRFNPRSTALYLELSWLYQHKVAGTSDRFAPYYREQLAATYGDLLGDSIAAQAAALTQPDVARTLRGEHRLDTEIMRSLHHHYGGIDWRAPEAHALYWATFAQRHADGDELFRAHRAVFRAVMSIMQQGRVLLSPGGEVYAMAPNLAVTERLLQMHRDNLRVRGARDEAHFYHAFLEEAARVYFISGHFDRARQIHTALLTGTGADQAGASVEAMLYDRLVRRNSGAPDARTLEQQVVAVYRDMLRWQSMGETGLYEGHAALAAALHATYTSRADADPGAAPPSVAPLAVLYGQAYAEAMSTFPPGLRRRLPPAGQRPVYSDVAP